jgi:hypothetical protein
MQASIVLSFFNFSFLQIIQHYFSNDFPLSTPSFNIIAHGLRASTTELFIFG